MNKRNGSKFTEEDERLMQGVSAQLGIAITNAILYRNQLDAYKYMQVILDCCQDFVFSISKSGMLQQANKRIDKLFPHVNMQNMRVEPCQNWISEGSTHGAELVRDIEHVLL